MIHIRGLRDLLGKLWLFLLLIPLSLRYAFCLALLYGGARRKEPAPTAEDLAWEQWEEQEIKRLEERRARPESGP